MNRFIAVRTAIAALSTLDLIRLKDAQSFREAGLSDETYIDVFNTVAIQQSFDRLANCIGVAADTKPLVARNNA